MSILVEETEIKPVKSARNLGIIFDDQLKWRSHIHHIEDKTATRICLLRFLSKLNLQANEQIMINSCLLICEHIIYRNLRIFILFYLIL